MRDWPEIENTPDFQTLDPEQQALLRQRWLLAKTAESIPVEGIAGTQPQISPETIAKQAPEDRLPGRVGVPVTTEPPRETLSAQEPTWTPESVGPLTPRKFEAGSPEAIELLDKLQKQYGTVTPRQYLEAIREERVKETGGVLTTWDAIASGIKGGLENTAALVATALGDRELAKAIRDKETYLTHTPPFGSWQRDLYDGVKSGVTSSTLWGLGLTLGLPPTAVALGIGGLFGADQYYSVMEQALEEGKDVNDPKVKASAIAQAIVEGGLDAALQYTFARIWGLGNRKVIEAAKEEAKRGISGAIEGLFSKAAAGLEQSGFHREMAKNIVGFMKRAGGTYLTEIPTEMIQNAAEAALNRWADLSAPEPWEAAKQAVAPTFWAATMMGMAGGMARKMINRGFSPVYDRAADLVEGVLYDRQIALAQAASNNDMHGVLVESAKLESDAKLYATLPVMRPEQQELSAKAIEKLPDPTMPEEFIDPDHVAVSRIPSKTALLSMLRESLPGVEFNPMGRYGHGVRATLPNGVDFKILWPATIVIPKSMVEELEGKEVAGFYSPLRKLMALSGIATRETVDHETYHVAQHLTLTLPELINEIEYFGGKPIGLMDKRDVRAAMERAAEEYTQWVTAQRGVQKHSNWGKIKDFAERLVRNAVGIRRPEDLWAEVASGKVWKRPVRQSQLAVLRSIGNFMAKKDKDGRFTGAPPTITDEASYKASIEKHLALLRNRDAIKQEYFNFYEDVARAVRQLSHGDDRIAEAFIRLLAFLSIGNNTKGNITSAIRSLYKFLEEGVDFRLPSATGKMASDILLKDDFTRHLGGIGPKVEAFYKNLIAAYYGRHDDYVTNDRHIARFMGYNRDSLTPAQYEFTSNYIRDLTARFNREHGLDYSPRHIQSALWAQARMALDPLGIENFVTALKRMQPAVAYEMFPGSALYAALPEPIRVGLERQLKQILNADELWNILRQLSKSSFEALNLKEVSEGGWGGQFTPNNILSFVTDEALTGKSKWKDWTRDYYPHNLARIAAAISTYVYHQDGVAWFREITPSDANTLKARTDGKNWPVHSKWFMHTEGVVVIKKDKKTGQEVGVTLEEAKRLVADMWASGFGGGFTLHGGTLYFLNFRDPSSGFQEFFDNTDDIFRAVARATIGEDVRVEPGHPLLTNEEYTIRRTDFIGNIEGGIIYEPNSKEDKQPQPVPIRQWLQERLTPELLSAVDNMRHKSAQEIKRAADEAGVTDILAQSSVLAVMEEGALTALVDPDKIKDLNKIADESEKYAGSMNVPNLSQQKDERTVARNLYLQNKASIDDARRLMSWEDILKQAKSVNISPETLKRWSEKGGLTREEMLALIRLNKWAVKNLTSAAANYQQKQTPEALIEAQLAYEASAKIMEIYQKAATEWGYVGKVLSMQASIKPLARSGMANPERAIAARNQALLAKVTKALGGQELSREKIARLTALLSDPNVTEEAVAKFIAQSAHVPFGHKLFTIWVNNLFSWVTHKVNLAGNAVALALMVPTKTVGGGFDLIRSLVTGAPREMYAAEGWHSAMGTLSALPEALHVAMKALVDPTFTTETKLENVKGVPFQSPMGRVFTYNLDLLRAADEFAKTLIRRGELHSKAYRLIRQLKPKDPEALFDSILANPDAYMEGLTDLTRKEALYRTFQAESRLANWLSAEPTGVLKWVVPFKRTLINLLKFAAEHSPLEVGALAIGKTFKPSAEKLSTPEVEEQLAKATLGGGLIMMGLLLASKGLISGSGPDDPKERENLYATGWRPYSIKTPWGRIDYQRIDILATLLGPIADAYDLITYAVIEDAEADKIMSRTFSMVARNILDKTMMLGLSKAIMAVMYPDRYGEKFWYSFLGSMVPANVTLVQRIMDPTLRKPESAWEVLKARLPILSEEVQPIYDHWGREVAPSKGLSLIQRLFNPTPIFDDDIATLLDNVVLETNTSIPRVPQRAMLRNISVDLTAEEIEIFATNRQIAYKTLQAVAPMLEKMPPDAASKYIRRVVERFDAAASARVKATPSFIARWKDALASRGVEREWIIERYGREE